jgi:hypothetical protein
LVLNGRRRRRRIQLGSGPSLLVLNGRRRKRLLLWNEFESCEDGGPATRPRSLAQNQVGIDNKMLVFEVSPVIVGASKFELAKGTLSGFVDRSDMSPSSLALSIT